MTWLRVELPPGYASAELPVEVRRPDLALVATTTPRDPVDLDPGVYYLSSTLPDGAELGAQVELGDEDLAAELEPDLEAPSPEPEQATDEFEALGPSGRVELRVYTGNVLTGQLAASAWSPVIDPGSDRVSITGQRRPMYVQARQPGFSEVSRAVPAAPRQRISVQATKQPGDEWRLDLHLPHAQADLLCRYRDQGLTRHAALAAAPLTDTAEALLRGKLRDPIAAAVGAYALLRFAGLDRLHDWTENLRNWFPWFPDGSAIRGEHLARAGDHAAAIVAFLELRERGLPYFSDGLAFAVNRLDYYRDVGASVFPKAKLAEAESLLLALRRVARAVDFGQPILAFRGGPGDYATLPATAPRVNVGGGDPPQYIAAE